MDEHDLAFDVLAFVVVAVDRFVGVPQPMSTTLPLTGRADENANGTNASAATGLPSISSDVLSPRFMSVTTSNVWRHLPSMPGSTPASVSCFCT